jgi:hypothetical protein
MKTPERTTAEVFPRYLGGEVLGDSATQKWPGLFARRYRFPRVVDGFLVPATAEPLITCHLNGSAEFQERDIGGGMVATTSPARRHLRDATGKGGRRASISRNVALRVLPLKEKSRDGLTALFCSEFSLAQRYAKVREGKDFSTWSVDWPW